MATKAMNFKMDETEIAEMKRIGAVYHMSLTQIVKEALKEYIGKMKADPFYKLTANVMNADEEETAEILSEIGNLSDEELEIASVEQVHV